jgi:tetratricopeptide (TPR) repeat protein
MNDSKEGRRLHGLAEESREKGEFLKALEYTDQALIAYQKDGDKTGLAEVLASRQSIFKQLYRATSDIAFLILEKHTAWAAVEMAEESGIKEALAIPYHNLGKYFYEAGDYKNAAMFFKKAADNLETYHNGRHGRSSVIADIRGHQYAAEYKAGDKTAYERAVRVLEDLKGLEEDSYNKNVWVTGAQLRIVEMLLEDEPEKSAEYLKKAEEIIKSDGRLILRAEQLKKLKNR